MKVLMIVAIASAFIHQTSGLVLKCKFEPKLLFDELKAPYTCIVSDSSELQTTATKRNISEIIGKHLSRQNNEHIKQLYIINQEMEYFPRNFNNFFKNLIVIHAGMNELKYLERNDLRGFKQLRYLYLYSNLLETLSSDIFQDNQALEYISLYNNRLMHIGSKILAPLKQLRTAYFNKNICIDKQAVASQQGISELRLEIAERCSSITDEDLMNMLEWNRMKMANLETKIDQMSERMISVLEMLKSMKADNKIDP